MASDRVIVKTNWGKTAHACKT